jgi:hypothetical protein
MGCLQIERFFHFAVRRGEQVSQHQAWYEQVDGQVCIEVSLDGSIEKVMTRIGIYRAFCCVQAYAPRQSVRVSIERLAQRIDVPTTFDVDVLGALGLGLGVWHGQKPPRVAAGCAVRTTPFQRRQHLISPHPAQISTQSRQHRDSKRTRTQINSKNGNPPLLLRRSLPRYIHPFTSSASQPKHPQANNGPTPVSVLLVNAIAVLSEDRFLARST